MIQTGDPLTTNIAFGGPDRRPISRWQAQGGSLRWIGQYPAFRWSYLNGSA